MSGQKKDAWRKSSHCLHTTCVELSREADGLRVRDGKAPHEVLIFTEVNARQFIRFVSGR
ncbi:DUF397 domain-containing protein [Actinokineospora pegani]|uniref:DUF397 domain-containing protein n=1 Tax=Actinokineospora pegani TaxID=2654637 RepID=UPI0012EA3D24|nr:DUF397 domain-containing protein [Actinokineospora pegani]